MKTLLPTRLRSLNHVLTLACSLSCVSGIATVAHANEQCKQPTNQSTTQPSNDVSSPFVWLERIPDSVDAAIVLNNPAQQFLLDDSNQSIHELATLGGLFTNTQSAFTGLLSAFGKDSQETMRALFSKHVVVLWDTDDSDSIKSPMFILNPSLDMNWTLVCEVEIKHLKQLQASFNPTPRSIEKNHTVLAIEQGRFNLLVLKEQHQEDHLATVILAPKKSQRLFKEIISAYADDKQTHRPILSEHEDLLAEIPTENEEWIAAWVVQFDRASNKQSKSACIGTFSPTPVGLESYFATDLQIASTQSQAPVGLLSAAGDDAIAAIAMASTPGFEVTNNSIGAQVPFFFGTKTPQNQIETDSASSLTGGPGFLIMRELTQKSDSTESINRSLAVTMFLQFLEPGADNSQTQAQHVDQVMYDLVAAFDPSQAPSYQGRFPNAIRTHQLDFNRSNPDQLDPGKADPFANSWPGLFPNISWISTVSFQNEGFITAITPQWGDAAEQVRWVDTACRTLKSIPDQPPKTDIITSGYIRPNRLFELMELESLPGAQNEPQIDQSILRTIQRLDWKIIRAPFGVQGKFEIEFANSPSPFELGAD